MAGVLSDEMYTPVRMIANDGRVSFPHDDPELFL